MTSLPARPRARLRTPFLLLTGSGISATGYLLTVSADVGNGPLFAVQDGLHRTFGWSLGLTTLIVGLALTGLAALLRAPLGPGTLAIPVVTSLWIEVLAPRLPDFAGTAIGARWAMFLFGTAVMVLGATMTVAASAGCSAMDGLMFGLSSRIGCRSSTARLGMEVTLAISGAMIGGRIGLGTVVMGITVGHLFQFWSHHLRRLGVAQPFPASASARAVARTRVEVPA